ncbi:MAG TPA: Flp family type IVb pilin [Anaerolineae bacterium]|nr:Flp family type IVb pilin [Anaerolineae bacterium]
MLKALLALLRREEGQDLAEYGLIIALVAIVCIAALTLLGGNLSSVLSQIASAI